MKRKPPNAGKGRKRGVPNKATADVRAAIAKVLESNAKNFSVWLASVAEGQKEGEPVLDEEGQLVLDDNGDPKMEWNWLRRPQPDVALKLAMDMAEYHIPKLARTELAAAPGNEGAPLLRVEFVQSKPES